MPSGQTLLISLYKYAQGTTGNHVQRAKGKYGNYFSPNISMKGQNSYERNNRNSRIGKSNSYNEIDERGFTSTSELTEKWSTIPKSARQK